MALSERKRWKAPPKDQIDVLRGLVERWKAADKLKGDEHDSALERIMDEADRLGVRDALCRAVILLGGPLDRERGEG
jgi:hypothetical protein